MLVNDEMASWSTLVATARFAMVSTVSGGRAELVERDAVGAVRAEVTVAGGRGDVSAGGSASNWTEGGPAVEAA